ncbi:MAG: hypothetical protein IPL75_11740 [Acidobacteria bacterium]|nr:hypothetical protein [Acidobacteriota bacterium]
MADQKLTLGQAIDKVIAALEPLDGDARATVVATACSHLKIPVASTGQVQPPGSPNREERAAVQARPPASSPAPLASPRSGGDIRSFRNEKKPRSAKEMACVVAFFLKELAADGERKDAVSSADLDKYFKHAQFKLPERMAQVLPDAKGSGYFDSAARGEYKLNAVGYNLVAHSLPPKPETA